MEDDTRTWIRQRNADVRAKRLASASPARPGGVGDLNNSAADSLAETAGTVAGVTRGGARLAQDAAGAVQFTENLLDPAYGWLHPGQPAWLPLAQSANDAVRRGLSAAHHPVQSIMAGASRANAALNPSATPAAPTATGEMRRRFDIGMNQGEVLFDIGAAALAPEAMGGPVLSAEEQVTKRMAQGMSEPEARYLAEPYKGTGSHWYPKAGLPRKSKNAIKLPNWLSDSPFNVLKPPGISRGDFYELHYQIDPAMHGARLADHIGHGWSGKKQGLTKNHPVIRVVRGAPPASRATVGGIAGVAGVAHREGQR
ncbi:MAG TPA: hypothetical protein VG960_00420 [Caulobacteraceae bacterium]|nr:hypothetical protein [Caulobacteraceae bacterium]